MSSDKRITIQVNGGCDSSKPTASLLRANFNLSKDYSSVDEKSISANLNIFLPIAGQHPSSAQSLARFLQKLFSKDKRLVPLPEWFHFALSEQHFSIKVVLNVNDIVLEISPGAKLEGMLRDLVGSLKGHAIDKTIEQDKSSAELRIASNVSLSDRIRAYCRHQGPTSLAYFLLDKTDVVVDLNIDEQAGEAVDRILGLLQPDFSFAYFALGESFDLKLDFPLVSKELSEEIWNSKGPNRALLGFFEGLLDGLIAYFRALSEDDLKKWAKMLKFLKVEIEPIEFGFAEAVAKDVGWLELEVSLSGMLELLELLVFHPHTAQVDKVSAFKAKFAQKYFDH